MKNLELYDLKRVNLPRQIGCLESLIHVNGVIFYVENNEIFYYDEETKDVQQICEEKNCITELVYFITLEQIWFGTGKDFVFIDPKTLEYKSVECQYAFISASCSPNHDFIAVCTADGKLKCYRYNFFNSTLNTAFNDEIKEPLTANTVDLTAQITWKNDSEHFCVCYYDDTYKISVFKVTGETITKAIDIPNIRPCITWRRETMVCARQDESNKFWICMYEKNGLFHTEFQLNDKVYDVLKIECNETGDVLIVHINTDEGSFLNIYTHMNFKYRLKQQLIFACDNPLTTFKFIDSTKYIISLMVTNTEHIIFYKFALKVQHGMLPNNVGFYSEVDGNLLKLHRIEGDDLAGRHEPIEIIKNENPINLVTFHKNYEKFLIVDSHSNIFIYTFKEGRICKSGEKLSLKVNEICFYNLRFTIEDKVLFVYLNRYNIHNLYEINVNSLEISPKQLNEYIYQMMYIPELEKLLTVKSDNILYLNDVPHLNKFDFEIHKVDYAIIDDHLYIITLDVIDQLRINNSIICKGANSFTLHGGYLFVTALVNKLYCIRLNNDDMQKISSKSLSNSEIFTRNCEDGSNILYGVPHQKHVLLYHPRGNTEMILCRNIALDQTQALIRAKRWKEAFEFLRIERLDLNLLVDINPYEFLDQTEDFVNALDAPNLLQLFLVSLSDDNVLETTYKDINYPCDHNIKNKRKIVSQAILNILTVDMEKYVKPAILAANCIGGVDACMDVLYQLFKTNGHVDKIIAEGVNCLNLYVVTDNIRQACLSKADICFARCIFGKLNLDPKLYEKFFTDMEKPGPSTFRNYFLIQDHLERYDGAVGYLIIDCMNRKSKNENYDDAEDVREMIEYAQTHNVLSNLYRHCIKFKFANNKITEVYAGKLQKEGRDEEAAIIFISNSMWKEALDIYVRCRMWKDAMYALERLQIDKTEYIRMLVKSLEANNNYQDAAYLYDNYLGDPVSAISCLIKDRSFKEAMQCGFKHNNLELIESVKVDYCSYYMKLMEKIESASRDFRDYYDRLKVVRDTEVMRIQESISNMEGDSSFACAGSSTASLRTATATRSSIYSLRSRKGEKKKQDLRHGGPFENIALMRAIHKLITEVYELSSEIRTINELYIASEFNGYEKAKTLQDNYSELLDNIKQNTLTIWPPKLNSVNIMVTPELQVLRKNLDELESKYRFPPEDCTINWKMDFLDELLN